MNRIGRPVAFAEPRLQPVEPLGAQLAMRLARRPACRARSGAPAASSIAYCRKPLARQVGVVGEDLAQRIARIVVAGNQVDRHRQRRQQTAQQGVFLGLAAIHQVAGGEHDVGPRIERA